MFVCIFFYFSICVCDVFVLWMLFGVLLCGFGFLACYVLVLIWFLIALNNLKIYEFLFYVN